jgi:AraC-like DNA-binding protein
MWIIVPSVLFTASFILTLIMGLERTDDLLNRIQNSSFDPANADSLERAYYLWTIILFRIVIIAEELFLLVYCFVLLRKNNFRLRHFRDFLFRNRAISVMGVQVYLSLLITLVLCLKVFLHPFFLHSPGWAVAISLTIAVQFFSFGFFALFGSKRYITRKDIRTAMRYNYTEENQAQVTEDIIMDLARDLNGESLTRVLARLGTQTGASPRKATRAADTPSLTSAIFSSAADTQGHESLATRFQHLMQVKRLFLQPGLTLSDVADELGTNKTYVSKMVNNTYNLGFPELLNIMRVDYACEYIRRHPEASQEEIARACGFFSASSFNGTFKRITGFTPKVWAARKDSLHLD